MRKYEEPSIDVVKLQGNIVTLSSDTPVDDGEDW